MTLGDNKIRQNHPQILPEFQDVLPALSEAEFQNLERDILQRGILQPLIVWNNVCIDGMHRLQIAQKHNLPYFVKQIHFQNKEEAKAWIFEHQIGRRNQSTFAKIATGLRFEDYYQKMAKENQKKSPGRGKKGLTKIVKRMDTAQLLAQKIGVARTYITNVQFILDNAPQEIIQQCQTGKLPIRTAYRMAREENQACQKDHSQYPHHPYPNQNQYENTILCGDVLKILPKIPATLATCCLFSPPYNGGRNFGFGKEQDTKSHPEYIDWLGNIIKECSRILREGGRLIINLDSIGVRLDDLEYKDGTKYTIYPDLINKVRELDNELLFKDEICWYKKQHGGRITAWGTYRSPANPNIRRNHEYILIWQKGKNSLKNICGIPSDLSKEDWNQSIYSVWEINPETAKRKEHSAPFPEELVRRLIKLYSFPQDLILDPFNGTGTTTAICAAQNRRWLGIDLNPDYCKKAKVRTEKSYKEWMKK